MKKIDTKFIVIIGVFSIIVIGGLYQLFVSPILTSYYLKKETRYAITSNLGNNFHGSRIVHYTTRYYFSINGKRYIGECDDRNIVGNHYFIAFNPNHPNYSKMTYIEATPADIDNMPPNGYKQLPHK